MVNKNILMNQHQLTLLISHILDDTCEIHCIHVAGQFKTPIVCGDQRHLPPLRKAALLFHVISLTFQAFRYIDERIFRNSYFPLRNVGYDKILRQNYLPLIQAPSDIEQQIFNHCSQIPVAGYQYKSKNNILELTIT